MKYSSDSNNNDCVSEILKICGATTNTYSLNDITRRFNTSLDDYFDLAFDADSQWRFDDLNQTSAAPVTQNLVSGTNSYRITAFTGSPIAVLSVNILDDGATVEQLIREEFDPIQFEENYDTSSTGEPTHYTLQGNYIYLRPTPNYSESNGLRAFVDREPLYMLSTDTIKEPGVPKKHHLYLCRKTALPYLLEHKLPHAQAIAQLIQIDEEKIRNFYSTRAKDLPRRMTAFKNDCK